MIELLSADQSDQRNMPYAFTGKDGVVLLFCEPDSRGRWRIKMLDVTSGETRRLRFQKSFDEECCPLGWFDGEWHFSFIARKDSQLYLFTATGDPTKVLTVNEVIAARAGFVLRDRIVRVERNEVVISDSASRPSFAPYAIERLSATEGEPDKILVTLFEATANRSFTVEYDPQTNLSHELLGDGNDLHKPTILNGVLIAAKRDGESRTLFETANITRRLWTP